MELKDVMSWRSLNVRPYVRHEMHRQQTADGELFMHVDKIRSHQFSAKSSISFTFNFKVELSECHFLPLMKDGWI